MSESWGHTCDPSTSSLAHARWVVGVAQAGVDKWSEEGYHRRREIMHEAVKDLRHFAASFCNMREATGEARFCSFAFNPHTYRAVGKFFSLRCKECKEDRDIIDMDQDFTLSLIRAYALEVLDADPVKLPPLTSTSNGGMRVITTRESPSYIHLMRTVIELTKAYCSEYKIRETRPVIAEATDRLLIPHLRTIVQDYAYGYTPSWTLGEFLQSYVIEPFRMLTEVKEWHLFDEVFYAQLKIAREKDADRPRSKVSVEDKLLLKRVQYMSCH